ncbi:PepSY-associated TM helix domain-containing protein [Cochlodiniinecator piscidefendens]|uniref:PepSY-associated TM helix domain-containing protein n=1 Tax=Cochlodiniinecator piscidefendens TaxID=2715756 RepID=UPI00140A03BF|nr:PepSY domain-containing protein [Cochlodiniinecator piscidefendens]
MSYETPAVDTADVPARGATFYRLVWKWHFLAALYVLPFMAILSVTGTLYLYKPQIEAWIYADRMVVPVTGEMLSLETQVNAVEEAVGVTRLRGITISDQPGRSTVIEFNDDDRVRSYAWVNPYTAELLAVTPRDETLMRMIKKFHGELLLGGFGTKFVELAAHWAIVMFVTGVIMWWPRNNRSLKDATRLPRGTGRKWWREAHLFSGMMATVLIVPILITGLPWTDIFGGGLSYVQTQTDQESRSLRFGGNAPSSTTSEGVQIPFASVLDIAKSEGLIAPYELRSPRKPEEAFWIRSASTNRFEQTELVIDQYSGEVLARVNFDENPVLAQAISLGISFHQGELYGPLNIVQNTLAAILGVFLSVSGFVAWWMRRPAGSIGVPTTPDAKLSAGVIIAIVVMMVLLPLMGLSLIVALCLDWLLFKRIGWFQSKPTNIAAE